MQNPILVEVYRANVLESFHRGVICVVNENNEVVFSKGSVEQVCYPRSAMKFIQVLPLIALGGIEKFGFTLEEIAVMCGSHNAEQEHIKTVESILAKIGLNRNDLFCGPQYPSSKSEANALIKQDKKPEHIHNNCSGKHAGMLALCQLINAPITDYINPNHAIQQLILEYVEKIYEYPRSKMATALDGCSAPIYSIPVINQAIGFKNLVSNNYDEKLANACKIMIEAVGKYPFMVAGSKRYCTDMMQICAPKIIGKTGAEGVFCMNLPEQKLGVCIKIDDGKMLPQYNVAQAFVEATGLFNQDTLKPLHHYLQENLTNFNKFTVG
ncbi:MAG: asparaginase, partial [Bacteroidia bacterium]